MTGGADGLPATTGAALGATDTSGTEGVTGVDNPTGALTTTVGGADTGPLRVSQKPMINAIASTGLQRSSCLALKAGHFAGNRQSRSRPGEDRPTLVWGARPWRAWRAKATIWPGIPAAPSVISAMSAAWNQVSS